MIEDWIDTLVEVWRINVGDRVQVKSPYILKADEFPASITPADDFPIALTFLSNIDPKYSVGFKQITWYGSTEFHVTPDLSKARNPELMLWPARILRAAAANLLLGGLVDNFVIMNQFDGIEGPVALEYGAEGKHWGFIVNWMVTESPSGTELPVTA